MTALPLTAASPVPAKRVLMKGNEAMAEAAIQAGCDAYFGYPITPQAELLEWMARRMPEEGRTFVQAESELGAINMALGAGATGARVLVSSSSPGISLMAEGMSYAAGSEVPLVLVNVMRGGPGLGSIGPSQSDYFQATKGHGHGDYHIPVLAPASVEEATEMMPLAFELAERYRTPVMILADGVLGQAMEPVSPVFRYPSKPVADWAVGGADGRRARVVKSLMLAPEDLQRHNQALSTKYATIIARETRHEAYRLADAEIAIVAYGTSARVARSAIDELREAGARVGLLRPVTLWPFPIMAVRELALQVRAILVVELSAGQMIEDVERAAASQAPVFFLGHTGGIVPTPDEVGRALTRAWALSVGKPDRRDAEADPVEEVCAGLAAAGGPADVPDDEEIDPVTSLCAGLAQEAAR